MQKNTISLLDHFTDLPDPRFRSQHKLVDIIAIALTGTICGAEGWDELQIFAEEKQIWLKTFLELPSGVPSADTLRRVFERLNPKRFEQCFSQWVSAVVGGTAGKIVAIDGKKARNGDPLTLVSAWTNKNKGLCLGQVATEKKSNEIKAIPELLKILDIQGALVTIDAAGCQKKIAHQIVNENKADYLLAVKANQPELLQTMSELLDDLASSLAIPIKTLNTYDDKRSRDELRRYTICHEVEWMPCLQSWPTIKTVGKVVSETKRDGKEATHTRYYISSKTLTVKEFANSVRGHWGIENKLHWVLDVVFNEDHTTIRNENSNQILSLIRKASINTFKRYKKPKDSIRQARKRCGWAHTYLEEMLCLQAF